jgi:hypothetical protein
MKSFVFAGMVVLSMAFSGSAATEAEKESVSETGHQIETLKADLLLQKNAEKETVDAIFRKSDEVEDSIRRLNESERSLGGISGLGNVEQMRVKAERYSLERQYRMKIQEQVLALLRQLQDWRAAETKIRETEERIALYEKIANLEKTVVEESPIGGITEQNFEYYQVERESSLQEISALPDVYGDANLWKSIFEANRTRLKRSDAKVPAGTLLIIPNNPATVSSAPIMEIQGIEESPEPTPETQPAAIPPPQTAIEAPTPEATATDEDAMAPLPTGETNP